MAAMWDSYSQGHLQSYERCRQAAASHRCCPYSSDSQGVDPQGLWDAMSENLESPSTRARTSGSLPHWPVSHGGGATSQASSMIGNTAVVLLPAPRRHRRRHLWFTLPAHLPAGICSVHGDGGKPLLAQPNFSSSSTWPLFPRSGLLGAHTYMAF